jgi:hypothetical protein
MAGFAEVLLRGPGVARPNSLLAAADFEFVPATGTLVVPTYFAGEVRARALAPSG